MHQNLAVIYVSFITYSKISFTVKVPDLKNIFVNILRLSDD